MAEQIINTIKPILVEELKKEIEEHKTDFDQVEKSIDIVIDNIDGKIKPIAGPIVKGIKLIPFGDPKEKLEKLDAEIEKKIDSIDLSTELSKIEGLPEDIKSRVASLPEKVKTKLKDSMDEIITGEEKPSDSTSTDVVESKTEQESASSISTDASSSSSTSTEASESKTESTPASSTSTDSNIQQTFSNLATDQKDEARKEIIKKLIKDKIFDNNEHIFEFIKIIDKVASPPTTEAEQPPTNEIKTNSNIPPAPPVQEAKPVESNTDGTNSNMPPAPPSATQATGTDESKTEEPNKTISAGGAPKKQRRKTKKNIRRNRMNKSTRFGRAF